MATLEALRSLIAEKFPGPAPVEETYFRTGVAAVDGEVGGLPRSALTECAGSMASGALMRHALIGAVVREGGFAALIDPAVGFDPCGCPEGWLERLLWVQPRDAVQSLAAADLLLRDGNLPLVLLDLMHLGRRELLRLPMAVWHRLQRLVEGSVATLVVFTREPAVESARLRLLLRVGGTLGMQAEMREGLCVGFGVRVERRRVVYRVRTA